MSIDGINMFGCVRCCMKRYIGIYVSAVVMEFGLYCLLSIIHHVGIKHEVEIFSSGFTVANNSLT